jgi:hypothetical protein
VIGALCKFGVLGLFPLGLGLHGCNKCLTSVFVKDFSLFIVLLRYFLNYFLIINGIIISPYSNGLFAYALGYFILVL